MKKCNLRAWLVIFAVGLLAGCAGGPRSITSVESNEVTDDQFRNGVPIVTETPLTTSVRHCAPNPIDKDVRLITERTTIRGTRWTDPDITQVMTFQADYKCDTEQDKDTGLAMHTGRHQQHFATTKKGTQQAVDILGGATQNYVFGGYSADNAKGCGGGNCGGPVINLTNTNDVNAEGEVNTGCPTPGYCGD